MKSVSAVTPCTFKSDNLECLEIVRELIASDALDLRGLVIIGPDTDGEIFCYAGQRVTATDAIVLGEFLKHINLCALNEDE
jgi:hypothetical protein